jgi:hypothetical protein
MGTLQPITRMHVYGTSPFQHDLTSSPLNGTLIVECSVAYPQADIINVAANPWTINDSVLLPDESLLQGRQ